MVRMGQKASSPLLVKKDCLITDFILNCWFKVNEDFFSGLTFLISLQMSILLLS